MILQRLKEFWERQPNTLPRGYQSAFITKKISIRNGVARIIAQTGEQRGSGKTLREGKSYDVPWKQRTSNIMPRLIHDDPEYALGFVGDGRDPQKVRERHLAYLSLLEEAFAETQDPCLSKLLAWFHSGGAEQLLQMTSFDPNEDLLIEVDGELITDRPAIQKFWGKDRSRTPGFCLVTGDFTLVGEIMPYPAKGVPDGQTSGTMLVSVNMQAGESYGLKGNLSAPISSAAAESICNGLNYLLGHENHCLKVGKTAYLCWTREPKPGFTGWQMVEKPDEKMARTLIEMATKGAAPPPLHTADYFVLALSANASRIVVRDYLETSLERVNYYLGKWFAKLDLINTHGQSVPPKGIYALGASLYRDAKKEMPKHVPVEIMRCVLQGTPLPHDLLALAVRRNTAMQGPFYEINNKRLLSLPRLMLIKAALHDIQGGKDLRQLYKDHEDPAYHCGRLLSVLESIQRLAIPGLNATLTDRHYGAACASPGAIFGVLIKDATSGHLPKLRKNHPKAFYALNERLQEVMLGIGDRYPMTLDYQGQGIFALGYYHQRADDIAQARAHSNNKENELADETPTESEEENHD